MEWIDIWESGENLIVDMCRDEPADSRAADLLADLRTIAKEQGALDELAGRMAALRENHARKGRLIEKLKKIEAE